MQKTFKNKLWHYLAICAIIFMCLMLSAQTGKCIPQNANTFNMETMPNSTMNLVLSLDDFFGFDFPYSVKPKTGKSNDGLIREPTRIDNSLSDLALPPETKIYAAGAPGGIKLDWAIDESANKANLIRVAVNSPTEPVLLILAGYNPTVWQIAYTERTHIVAVMVCGYHNQRIAGLPKDVPVSYLGSIEGSSFTMPNQAYMASSSTVNKISTQFFGRKVDQVFGVINGDFYTLIGEDLSANAQLITNMQYFHDTYVPLDFSVIEDETAYKDWPNVINPAECIFPKLELPTDVKIYVAGTYAGKSLGFQIDKSRDTAGLVRVAVNSPQNPAVLMLGAYQPTIWQVGWTENTKIVAVFASGHSTQKVIGLPHNIPVLISTYQNEGACGHFNRDSVGGIYEANEISQRLFGRKADDYFGVINGQSVIGEILYSHNKLITHEELGKDDFINPHALSPGETGLVEAIHQGFIRPVAKEEIKQLLDAVIKETKSMRFIITGGYNIGTSYNDIQNIHHETWNNVYEVLSPNFVIPYGVCSSETPVTFMLQRNMIQPKGSVGLCKFVIFDIPKP